MPKDIGDQFKKRFWAVAGGSDEKKQFFFAVNKVGVRVRSGDADRIRVRVGDRDRTRVRVGDWFWAVAGGSDEKKQFFFAVNKVS